MTATIWSKFFWSDWQAEPTLRRCALAARGLWIEMLCLAAQAEPAGFLVKDGEPLDLDRLARTIGAKNSEVKRLLTELETEGVFSRDRRGRIYSRRIVRDAKLRASASKAGKRGGNPTLCNSNEKSWTLKGTLNPANQTGVGPISQKPESISQKPAARSLEPRAAGRAGDVLPFHERTVTPLLQRAAAAMRTDAALLAHKPAWAALPAFVVELVTQGCDAERDVWPVMERLAARLSAPPTSPAYFRDAILESKARNALPWVAPEVWQDRLRVFEEHGGMWAKHWGPKPGEPGCLATEHALAEAV